MKILKEYRDPLQKKGKAKKITDKIDKIPPEKSVRQKNKREVVYPDSDGKPMADNTKQFNWIVKIKENLERMFDNNSDVFVAGDLLWYPVEGNNKIRIAPDAMVAFGRPKGDRGSYRQWVEGGIAPQVVFEILSPGNTVKEMKNKLIFYEKYSVEEYYLYDPDNIRLNGWIRSGDKLLEIENMQGWISPRLNIRFELKADDLDIFAPDGNRFLSTVELEQKYQSQVQAERQKAEAERRKAESEHRRAEFLAAQLRALGIEPEEA